MQRNQRGVPKKTRHHLQLLEREGVLLEERRWGHGRFRYSKQGKVLFPLTFWERSLAWENYTLLPAELSAVFPKR